MWVSWGSRAWVIEVRDGRWSENWNSGRFWPERALDLKGREVKEESSKARILSGQFCPFSIPSPLQLMWPMVLMFCSLGSLKVTSELFSASQGPIFLESPFEQGPELNGHFGDLSDSTPFTLIKIKHLAELKHTRNIRKASHLEWVCKSQCGFRRSFSDNVYWSSCHSLVVR